MARSFPPDVVVLDTDSLLHARFASGKAGLRLVQSKSYRMAPETFAGAPVTPKLADEASLADALRRLRVESGSWQKVSVLLPDAWFRVNLLELTSLPDRPPEALEMIRWSLKRTIPIPPEQLRIAWTVLSRSGREVRILALSALEATMAGLERVFSAAGFEVVLIEPVAMNIWNAIAVREPETAGNRLLVHIREADFTTAVFRGAEPLFVRTRNLHAERTIEQEIRLSATYLRETLALESFDACHLAGQAAGALRETLAGEFGAEVRPVHLRDFAQVPQGAAGGDAELTACTGVFTG